jgi:hypothetical protein
LNKALYVRLTSMSLFGGSLLAVSAMAQAVAVPGQGTWETTLQARDLDGNMANGAEAYYDSFQNITWLADANYLKTSNSSLANADGKAPMLIGSSTTPWRTITAYNKDWSLPNAPLIGVPYKDPTCPSYLSYVTCYDKIRYEVNQNDVKDSHLKILFEKILGNKAADGSYALTNTGPFLNVKSDAYLTNIYYNNPDNQYWPDTYTYSTATGSYARSSYAAPAYAMFNTVGDFGAPIPEASTWAMTMLGLVGVMLVRARKAMPASA